MQNHNSIRTKAFWITVTILVWLAATYIGWVGYTASHGIEKHWKPLELPSDFYSFRVIGLAASRASILLFGPSEVAYRLPSLVGSLIILASVAWFVGWPRNINWQTQTSVLIACTLPLDAGMRSTIGVPYVAAAFLTIGAVCIIKGRSWVRYLGAALLGLGFEAHEISLFFIAIFCVTSVVVDWRRFIRPALATLGFSCLFILIECVVYAILLDDPLARWNTVASATDFSTPVDLQVQFGGSLVRFYAWPLQVLVFCKQWSIDLLLLLMTGVLAWRRMNKDMKILFVAIFVLWLWLGYGTQVPWAYRPRSRTFHYFFPLTLGIAALLPYTLQTVLGERKRFAHVIIVLLIGFHLVLLSAGGAWQQTIDVSRDLLHYAQRHPDERFLTDTDTLQEMQLVNRFQSPANVVDLSTLGIKDIDPEHILAELRTNRIDSLLINLERPSKQLEDDFRSFLDKYGGERTRVAPLRNRLLFVPIAPIIGQKSYMIKRLGGDLVEINFQVPLEK